MADTTQTQRVLVLVLLVVQGNTLIVVRLSVLRAHPVIILHILLQPSVSHVLVDIILMLPVPLTAVPVFQESFLHLVMLLAHTVRLAILLRNLHQLVVSLVLQDIMPNQKGQFHVVLVLQDSTRQLQQILAWTVLLGIFLRNQVYPFIRLRNTNNFQASGSCSPCEMGYYSNSLAATNCTACPAGSAVLLLLSDFFKELLPIQLDNESVSSVLQGTFQMQLQQYVTHAMKDNTATVVQHTVLFANLDRLDHSKVRLLSLKILSSIRYGCMYSMSCRNIFE